MTRANVSLAVFLAVAICGCERDRNKIVGSGISKTEHRQVGMFDEFEFHGAGRVELAVGELQPLEITADDNILPLLRTEVVGTRLVVRPVEPIRPKVPIVLRVAVPELKLVSGAGNLDVVVEGLKNDAFSIEIKGDGKVVARGETDHLKVSVTGNGDVRTADLTAQAVDVTITGNGHVVTHALKTLNVSITGAGTVRYLGEPDVDVQIIGKGTVKKD